MGWWWLRLLCDDVGDRKLWFAVTIMALIVVMVAVNVCNDGGSESFDVLFLRCCLK